MNPDKFNISEYQDYVVIDRILPSESETFNDYMIIKWTVHPEAQQYKLNNNLAILFLGQDVKFSSE